MQINKIRPPHFRCCSFSFAYINEFYFLIFFLPFVEVKTVVNKQAAIKIVDIINSQSALYTALVAPPINAREPAIRQNKFNFLIAKHLTAFLNIFAL
jgi:hypothetical protein